MIDKDFWKNKKVLLTGHTGFKGSWLSCLLDQLGARVFGLSLPPVTAPSLFEELNKCFQIEENFFNDIRDFEKINKIIMDVKPEIIFHLAAQPIVRESYIDPIGTWNTNVMGSLNILQACSNLDNLCSIVMITTDKVYKNKEWEFGYRESDELGGHDPYSASKAACEIAIQSWRSSFCNNNQAKASNILVSSARSGNVIGGGDWSKYRIIPDTIKALKSQKEVIVRNPKSTRPWQHVLEPLVGYMLLAEKLSNFRKENNLDVQNPFASAYNFGPNLESNRQVSELVSEIFNYWPGISVNESANSNSNFHEAQRLNLQVDKAYQNLSWTSKWNFETTVQRTINWYKQFYSNDSTAYDLCKNDINFYLN